MRVADRVEDGGEAVGAAGDLADLAEVLGAQLIGRIRVRVAGEGQLLRPGPGDVADLRRPQPGRLGGPLQQVLGELRAGVPVPAGGDHDGAGQLRQLRRDHRGLGQEALLGQQPLAGVGGVDADDLAERLVVDHDRPRAGGGRQGRRGAGGVGHVAGRREDRAAHQERVAAQPGHPGQRPVLRHPRHRPGDLGVGGTSQHLLGDPAVVVGGLEVPGQVVADERVGVHIGVRQGEVGVAGGGALEPIQPGAGGRAGGFFGGGASRGPDGVALGRGHRPGVVQQRRVDRPGERGVGALGGGHQPAQPPVRRKVRLQPVVEEDVVGRAVHPVGQRPHPADGGLLEPLAARGLPDQEGDLPGQHLPGLGVELHADREGAELVLQVQGLGRHLDLPGHLGVAGGQRPVAQHLVGGHPRQGRHVALGELGEPAAADDGAVAVAEPVADAGQRLAGAVDHMPLQGDLAARGHRAGGDGGDRQAHGGLPAPGHDRLRPGGLACRGGRRREPGLGEAHLGLLGRRQRGSRGDATEKHG